MNAVGSVTGEHPDLAKEQAHLDRAYVALQRMRNRAEHLKGLGYLGGNVTEGGVETHDRQQWDLDKQKRIDQLTDHGGVLCFGRIDRYSSEQWYIGRRHIEDEDGEALVTDWRAAVAVPFYRATVADPMGLDLRRRFLVETRQIVDIFDENLAEPGAVELGAYVPDPLLAEVGRGRTGSMRDIVATIQAEQDVIIRAPLQSCVVVQGGPGTGKTAVGLHRAAYLLYEHRSLLQRERLLIVGPNRIFLRYISQVLPSLGEVASAQLTIEGLAGVKYQVGGPEPSAAARLKGDRRMAEVVHRAVFDNVGTPGGDVEIPTSFGAVRLPADEIAAVVVTVLERSSRYSDGRQLLREQLVDLAWTTHVAKSTSDVTRQAIFEADVRSSHALKALLDKAWPTITASSVLRRLFAHKPLLLRATKGLFAPEEAAHLARRAAKRAGDQKWSRADLALLDEAEALISGPKQTYGHIVVDEAQDLSAMELRMIARRGRRGSITALGDLAQTTSPGGQTDWVDAVHDLGIPDAHLDELTIGYRVPEPIMAFANRLLPHAAPSVRPPRSVRSVGQAPVIVSVDPVRLAAAAAEEAATVASIWPLTAVVTPEPMRKEIGAALEAAGVAFVDGVQVAALGEHITVLPPASTKGLEFDAVVVVEPGLIVAEADGDFRLLYVVLTRSVQHLRIVHAQPLPSVLTSCDAQSSAQVEE
jgi:DNA helicase IV